MADDGGDTVTKKQIKKIKEIVPSLNFPFKSRGKKNLRKIINKTKYIAALMANFINSVASCENIK